MERKTRNALFALMLFVILVLISIIIFISSTRNINDSIDNQTQNNLNIENQTENNLDIQNEEQNTNAQLIESYGYNSSELVTHFLDLIEYVALQDYLLKSVDGDVTALKMLALEAKNNMEVHRTKLQNVIENELVIKRIYKENDKVYCEYNAEAMLNHLGLGTHMGMGLNADKNGVRTYTFGEGKANVTVDTNRGLIASYGYSYNELITHFLDLIENVASQNYLLKSVDGDVSAPKMLISEAKSARENHRVELQYAIEDETIIKRIYKENDKFYCEYNAEAMLNHLNLGTHMGVGLNADRNGMKTYTFE